MLRKVLYVSHNHPANAPGGVEVYSLELHEAMGRTGRFESILLTRVGPPETIDRPHGGTRFALAGDDPGVYYMHIPMSELDCFLWTARDKRLYTEDWHNFLLAVEPDLVHFHHSLWLGYDMIRETRSSLPYVPIVYTLHGFFPICANYGQMIRTETNALCGEASPCRCHGCFPKIPAQSFFLRERFVKSAFELVDMFIVPSEFTRRRYIEWGLPPERIKHENYGRIPVAALPDPPDAGRRKRVGYIGRITPHKGVDVLLKAIELLQRQGVDVQLMLCGTVQAPPEFRAKVERLLEETASSVQFIGRYEQAQLPAMLSSVDWVIVPSIWWETGPLSIHEARLHGRPVICSDIGSMAERIRDGVDGLHFAVGEPESLAETIARATSSPELWDELRANIAQPHPMDAHIEVVSALYEELLARERAQITPVS